MSQSSIALRKLRQLLKLEKAAHLAQFNASILNSSPQRRQTKGVSWYPVFVRKMGYGLGDHPFVLLERKTQWEQPHQFKAGNVVTVFCKQFGLHPQTAKGVIQFVTQSQMKVIFYMPDLPEWIRKDKIGVDLAFDEYTFLEMDKALQTVMEAKESRLAELREILLGNQKARFQMIEHPITIPSLNTSQNQAVNRILSAQDVVIIHGPPGTGKTTTLVQAIVQLAQSEGTILACAPSNPAVDLLTEKLLEQGLTVVRLGNISRVNETLLRHTVEGHLTNLPEYERLQAMKREAENYRKKARTLRGKLNLEERAQRKEWLKQATVVTQQVGMIENYLIDQLITQADVVCCTLVGAASPHILHKEFETLVIDEAAQALEAATWIPITRAKKVVLVGDPHQLPPTIVSIKAQRQGLHKTLMEKCLHYIKKVVLLQTQYRMNELIMGFSNQEFYQNQLQADSSVKNWQLSLQQKHSTKAVEFIDTAGCGYTEQMNPQSKSYFNPQEYAILGQHLDILLNRCVAPPRPSVGIISPYKEQTTYIQEALEEHEQLWELAAIDINTVDAFQGQERDIIYISLVRSNAKKEIGFLKDFRRMNVAMTRAKKKLVIIGDSATLEKYPFYQNLVAYCKANNCYTRNC